MMKKDLRGEIGEERPERTRCVGGRVGEASIQRAGNGSGPQDGGSA